jgi:hypothetical protein
VTTTAGATAPSAISVDGRQVTEFLMGLPPDRLVPLGAPVWWLNLNVGRPANVCLDSALVLREAYAQLGVSAEPKAVVLDVRDEATGREYVFGSERPRFEGEALVGHLGLWLPESGWFVDQTAQQFEVLAGQSWLPIMVRRPRREPWGQGPLTAGRGRLALSYRAVPDEVGTRLLARPSVRAAVRRRHRRAGVNLAASLVELLRGAGYRERALAGPSRLRRLIHEVNGAPVVVDDDRNVRFRMPGTRGVQLDEIG